MQKELYKELEVFEQKHWWFLGRKKIVLYFIELFFKDRRDLKICDLGCGTGEFLKDLNNYGEALGVDSSEDVFKLCDESVRPKIRKGQIPDFIPFDNDSFDLITMLDVAEHLNDDIRAFRKSCKLLKQKSFFNYRFRTI